MEGRQPLSAVLLGITILLAGCQPRHASEVEVEIYRVGIDSESHSPVVVLQEKHGTQALPIWIGALEAQAISMQVDGVAAPRPLTHDLIKTMLDVMGAELQRVVVTELRGGTFYARIYIHANGKDLDFDSRPSDAIALALRFHRPIFVATALMKGGASLDIQRQAKAQGSVKLAGVTLQNLTDELAEYFSLPAGRGVLVADVSSEAAAQLQRGDVILEVDGDAVSNVREFDDRLSALAKGTPAQLSVQRGSERVDASLLVTGK